MLELINDSKILDHQLTSTKELADVGFSNMILAIEEIQKQQGIAGTTAREALHTIEGSANAAKKAWDNIILAIGRGEGLEDAISGLTTALFGDDSGGGYVRNVVPRVQMVLKTIGDLISQGLPVVLDAAGNILSTLLPDLINSTLEILKALAKQLPGGIKAVFVSAVSAVSQGFDSILPYLQRGLEIAREAIVGAFKALPGLISGAGAGDIIGKVSEIIENIVSIIREKLRGIGNALASLGEEIAPYAAQATQMIGQRLIDGFAALPGKIAAVVDALKSTALPRFAEFAGNIIGKIKEEIGARVDGLKENGAGILAKINEGISAGIDFLVDAAINIITGLSGFIRERLPLIASVTAEIMNGIANGIRENLPYILVAAGDIALNIAAGILRNLPSILLAIGQVILDLVAALINSLPQFIAAGRNLMQSITDGVRGAIGLVVDALKQAASNAWNAFVSFDWLSAGRNIIDGIVSGITGGAGRVVESIRNMAGNAIGAFTGKLRISSPSKVFEKLSGFIPEGAASGIKQKAQLVYDAVSGMARDVETSFSPDIQAIRMPEIDAPRQTLDASRLGTPTSDQSSLIAELQGLRNDLQNMVVTLDGDAVVGGIASRMDEALGSRAVFAGRGI